MTIALIGTLLTLSGLGTAAYRVMLYEAAVAPTNAAAMYGWSPNRKSELYRPHCSKKKDVVLEEAGVQQPRSVSSQRGMLWQECGQDSLDRQQVQLLVS